MAGNDEYEVTHDLERQAASGDPAPSKQPERIGRYRIDTVLGKGGFGLVYLAHDEQLDRPVAVKVPHATLISRPEDAASYLAEARTVASLDHPNIVPVHDVGSTEQWPCYVVSKFIDGTDLSTRLEEQRPSYRESAELVATVAEALHYAHKQGLVHRDVKPGNILIDNDGRPYIVDFGLALREENVGTGPKYAGTPAYMSPEQARGEGHRVDGRSDVFSLGVVFYELLVGRQPFRAHTQAESLEKVKRHEPRPLRQYDENLPKELERICLKAMAKRASERYSAAHDLAEDLRLFLAEETISESGTTHDRTAVVASDTPAPAADSSPADPADESRGSTATGSSFGSQPLKIVPKGLRSFDAQDADFFLELLPGPRDRMGLPGSLRFWKTRIEDTDPDDTFSVGLIYGPSGCGKSSLVKAGLLPRLSSDVIPVYIEATSEETEARLLHGLRKRCDAVDGNLNLIETLAELRRGKGIPCGKNVLIVLDQFEQWLHTHKEEEHTDLVQALRQCDGGHVQCIVMVRDDFWMAVTRFIGELEVELVQGHNFAAVDLFPIRHAQSVLAAFGRAFGALPDSAGDTSKVQREFLEQAVAGLAEDNKVVCVRLALFAEMMKDRPWTPTSLKEVGGTAGIGVTFLEETFSANTNPRYRMHQKAARRVLKALLPESGADIKGHMRSRQELLEASGYASRAREFDDLLNCLDGELRLITPTEPDPVDEPDAAPPIAEAQYYQLTHDYLVPSLRDWLTRKQRETRRGRAEIRLAELAADWNAKPGNKGLPSLGDYIRIRVLTRAHDWTLAERALMSRAKRYHRFTSVGRALLWLPVILGVLLCYSWFKASVLVDIVVATDGSQLNVAVSRLRYYRIFADPILKAIRNESVERNDKDAEQRARYALIPSDLSEIRHVARLGGGPNALYHFRDLISPEVRQWLLEDSLDKNLGFNESLGSWQTLVFLDGQVRPGEGEEVDIIESAESLVGRIRTTDDCEAIGRVDWGRLPPGVRINCWRYIVGPMVKRLPQFDDESLRQSCMQAISTLAMYRPDRIFELIVNGQLPFTEANKQLISVTSYSLDRLISLLDDALSRSDNIANSDLPKWGEYLVARRQQDADQAYERIVNGQLPFTEANKQLISVTSYSLDGLLSRLNDTLSQSGGSTASDLSKWVEYLEASRQQ